MKAAVIFLALFLSSTMAWADSEIKIPTSKYQQAMYDRVWDAAIDTLFELGLPIAFMSKPDGYMVTDREWDKTKINLPRYSPDRVRVTMRFIRTNDSINVKISSAEEGKEVLNIWTSFSKDRQPFPYWEVEGPSPHLEKAIVDRISSKLKPVEETK